MNGAAPAPDRGAAPAPFLDQKDAAEADVDPRGTSVPQN